MVANKMRRTVLVSAFLSLSVLASDPDYFVGKWKLNLAKSDIEPGPDFHPGQKLRRGSATFRLDRGGYDFEISSQFSDGQYWRIGAPITFDGGISEGALDGKPVVYTGRRVNDHSFKILSAEKQTGKVTQLFLFNVSSDNTTLVLTSLKLGEKTPSLTMTFDKQQNPR